jgi:hypothetical protein
MTAVFDVNGNNDIFTVNGRLQVATGKRAVLVHAERAMKASLREMIYAVNRGVDYFGDVFSGSPNIRNFEAGARAQILRVEGVVSIDSFDASVQNNQLIYRVTIRTEFGAGAIEGTL